MIGEREAEAKDLMRHYFALFLGEELRPGHLEEADKLVELIIEAAVERMKGGADETVAGGTNGLTP